MTKEVISLPPEAFLKEAIILMSKNNIGCVLILNNTGKTIGIITEQDVLDLYNQHQDINKLQLQEGIELYLEQNLSINQQLKKIYFC